MGQHCLISGISNGILSDIIKNALTSNDVEVSESLLPVDKILDEIQSNTGCIFMGMNNKSLPDEYKHIFDVKKNMIVVEILNNGKSMGLYIDDINTSVLEKIVAIK